MGTVSWDSEERGGRLGRRRRFLLGTSGLLFVLFVLGPRVSVDERWVDASPGLDLEAWLATSEAGVPSLRPEAAKAIEWHDPTTRESTDLALVYLHGFSADRHEIDPVISDLADSLGANVYYARLTGHGRDGAAMAEASVGDWFDDAVEALAVGARIGSRVVVVGTSTGGTLATWLGGRPESRSALAGLVLVSPNFHPVDRMSRILLWPWGAQITRLVLGRERCWEPANAEQGTHWTTCYPVEALPPMMGLVEHVRTMDHGTVTTPTLALYSPADQVVDASETEFLVPLFGSETVSLVEVPAGNDPGRHVLAGDILSPDRTGPTVRLMLDFIRSLPAATPRSGSP